MEESKPSEVPEGLIIEAVEWLPSGARSGLVRVRGRWEAGAAPGPGLPVLLVAAADTVHRFASLPDPRGDREPGSWRGAYVVNGDLLEDALDALSLEFPGGATAPLPAPGGTEPVAEIAPPAAPVEPSEPGGEVIGHAVLADRRAQRAEASLEAQAKIAREAMAAVEVLELRAGQLEEQLLAITTQRDTLARQAAEATPPHEIQALRERLDELQEHARTLEAELTDAPRAAAQARTERLREALTAAVTTIAELRGSLREAHLQRRTADIERTANAVRVAVLDAERSGLTAQLAAARTEIRDAHAAAAEARQLAVGAQAAHDETRRRFTQRVAALEEARARIVEMEREIVVARETATREAQAAAEAAVAERESAVTRRAATLEAAAAEQQRVAEKLGRREEDLREGLRGRETQLQAEFEVQIATRNAQLTADFERREAELDARLESIQGELEGRRTVVEAQLAEERAAWQAAEKSLLARVEVAEGALGAAQTARDIAEAAATAADAERRAATVARASMTGQATPVGIDPGVVAQLERRLAAERSRRQADIEALTAERTRLSEISEELTSERVRIQQLEAELAQARVAAEAAAAAPAAAETVVAEPVAPAIPLSLVPPPGGADPLAPDRAQVVADLDRAAASLRERSEPEAEATLAVAEPEAVAAPARATIVSATTHPPRPLVMGKAGRDYPPLRGALVKLAHDDPAGAAELIVGLLPAQWRAFDRPLDYDLTIGDGPTYRVDVTVGNATVTEVPAARARGEADFHLQADAVLLSELIAGVAKFRLFSGPRSMWGRKAARALSAIGKSGLTLTDVLRDGAVLDPALVLRCLEYAVPIAWTRGHDFVIEERIVGGGDRVVYVTSRDGRGLSVSSHRPPDEPTATIVLTRPAFDAMLLGETPPLDERPIVRGDHHAVDTLRDWASRVRAGDV